MNTNTVDVTNLGGPALKQDFSAFSMFLQADFIVQIVMVMLLAASFWSWTIIFAKWIRFRNLEKLAERFEEKFWSGIPLDQLHQSCQFKQSDPMTTLFCTAMKEWQQSTIQGGRSTNLTLLRNSIEERVNRIMNLAIDREVDRLQQHLGFLATTGSIAPFVGLFGTVWGIMNSLQSIATMQNTNLSVVAPGIAEALLATGIGLVAAIPAVIFYNKFAQEVNRYGARLDAFAAEFNAIISRRLEQEAA